MKTLVLLGISNEEA